MTTTDEDLNISRRITHPRLFSLFSLARFHGSMLLFLSKDFPPFPVVPLHSPPSGSPHYCISARKAAHKIYFVLCDSPLRAQDPRTHYLHCMLQFLIPTLSLWWLDQPVFISAYTTSHNRRRSSYSMFSACSSFLARCWHSHVYFLRRCRAQP